MKTKTAESKKITNLQPKEKPLRTDVTTQNDFIGFLANGKIESLLGFAPDIVRRLRENDIAALIQKGLGQEIGIDDIAYVENGAEIYTDSLSIISQSGIVAKNSPLTLSELEQLKENQIVVVSWEEGQFSAAHYEILAKKKISILAYNLLKDKQDRTITSTIEKKQEATERNQVFADFLLPLLFSLTFSKDIKNAIQTAPQLIEGIICYKGQMTSKSICTDHHLPYKNIMKLCWNWN